MFQRIALAAIVIAFATPAIAPVPAGAYQAQHYFDKVLLTNHTNECAWITVYTASPFSAWSIVNTNPQNRPQWLKPHEAKGFYFYESAEVKVRAEVKQRPDCSGSTTIDTYDIRKNPTSARQTLTAGLYPNANRFNLWFH